MDPIGGLFSKIEFGKKKTYRNVTLFPIQGNETGIEFISLSEGMEQDQVVFLEMGNVPEIQYMNCSKQKLLIIEGEELVGAKQNRLINTSILMPEKSSGVIPVPCCEEGRWQHSTKIFGTENRIAPNSLRAILQRGVSFKMLSNRHNKFQSDQKNVWKSIRSKQAIFGTQSPTLALSDTYRDKENQIKEFQEHFPVIENQIGYAVAINSTVTALEIFGTHYAKYHHRIVQGIALDAIEHQSESKDVNVRYRAVRGFISRLQKMEYEQYDAIGIGTNLRSAIIDLTAAALIVDDQVVHFAGYLG